MRAPNPFWLFLLAGVLLARGPVLASERTVTLRFMEGKGVQGLAEPMVSLIREALALEPERFELMADPVVTLNEIMVAVGCTSDNIPCLTTIGESFQAEMVIYGSVVRAGKRIQITAHQFSVRQRRKVRSLIYILPLELVGRQGFKEAIQAFFDVPDGRVVTVDRSLEPKPPGAVQPSPPLVASPEKEAGFVMSSKTWVALSATAAAGVATAILGGMTLSLQSDFDGTQKYSEALDLQAKGESYALATNILLGLAGAGALTSVIFILVDNLMGQRGEPANGLALFPLMLPQGGGTGLSGAF